VHFFQEQHVQCQSIEEETEMYSILNLTFSTQQHLVQVLSLEDYVVF